MDYSLVHITLLTYIRSVSYTVQSDLCDVLQKIVRSLDRPEFNSNVDTLDAYIATINTKINPTGFRVAKHRAQVSGDVFYVFVNTVSDEITKVNTNYSVPEIDAIKRIIDDLIDQSDLSFSLGYVNSSQRIGQTLNKTSRESNVLLSRLVDDGWFDVTEEDRVTLSIRSICELKHYLIDKYGVFDGEDVSQQSGGKLFVCRQCKELVTQGEKCVDSKCPISFHYKCLDFYKRSNDVKCPNYDVCGYVWSDQHDGSEDETKNENENGIPSIPWTPPTRIGVANPLRI
ncbi:hypothetical protein CAAN3_06S05468 [[Candida] anglica]